MNTKLSGKQKAGNFKNYSNTALIIPAASTPPRLVPVLTALSIPEVVSVCDSKLRRLGGGLPPLDTNAVSAHIVAVSLIK
jgi:hypothetical protein